MALKDDRDPDVPRQRENQLIALSFQLKHCRSGRLSADDGVTTNPKINETFSVAEEFVLFLCSNSGID